jgi:creatinine amidohydrolase
MQLTDMTWPMVDKLPRTTPVLIPIAALEQHGHHMPVFTDSLLLGEVVKRAREPLEDRVLFAPLMWLGNSEHHLDYPGTMTASPRLYLDLLRDLAENFLFHGFQRIVFLNGQKYRERSDLLLLASTYWTLGGKPNEVRSDIKQPHMGHACEWETSMMLRIRPELVRDLDKTQAVEFGNPFQPASRGWITKDRTPTGHIGDPRNATAEKGETIFTVFAEDVVTLMERVIAWNGKSWSG